MFVKSLLPDTCFDRPAATVKARVALTVLAREAPTAFRTADLTAKRPATGRLMAVGYERGNGVSAATRDGADNVVDFERSCHVKGGSLHLLNFKVREERVTKSQKSYTWTSL